MTFIARIINGSVVFKNWHGAKKPSGSLAGVLFRWEPGDVYRSDVLTSAQIHDMANNSSVMLEMISSDMPEATPLIEEDVPVIERWKPPSSIRNGMPAFTGPRKK